ncbi:precorrin-2 C(20)-methyltransferase [Spongiibacter sp. KMU-166]|uniref:Precorrin-2 C(20)-methyltransferase n=1 Tax=Spongiibacter thalassae TaxID=2721624 RepID=A0ABX1GK36_9GAMM|nr:precorrin-2 C(20)-methyltransferase [Spongiibacter thalassae]NKI19320.1 precorrin-2 C(20)-methyltransferase [Spongiibacter thalassae]
MKQGKLIGASLGPGDPGMITRAAWEALHSGARWCWPVRRKNGESYALAIALAGGLLPPNDGMALVFPMTHDRARLEKYWHAAAETVIAELRRGRDVVFLVEGDASTYSTFGHLARTVRALAADLTIETLAGVPAYNAACARLAQPLADVDDTVAIVPAAYGVAVVDAMLADFDTLVLLKVKPLLDELIALLRRRGLLSHSRFIEKAGSADERVIHDITLLEGQKVNYLSLLIVRNPDRIKGERQRGCRKAAPPPNPSAAIGET